MGQTLTLVCAAGMPAGCTAALRHSADLGLDWIGFSINWDAPDQTICLEQRISNSSEALEAAA